MVWLLEHDPPVVTVGRREAPGTPGEEALAAVGTQRFAVERGGLATWHGPGQLVAWLVVDAPRRGLGVRTFVEALESAVIGWLATRGVAAHRRTGHPGVWVGRDKICAVGLHFRRGVSMHGIALNLRPDLGGFGLIVPCGITDGGVTSLLALRGASPSPKEAAPEVAGVIIEELNAASRRRIDSPGG